MRATVAATADQKQVVVVPSRRRLLPLHVVGAALCVQCGAIRDVEVVGLVDDLTGLSRCRCCIPCRVHEILEILDK